MKRTVAIAVMATAFLGLRSPVHAQEWGRFRGPNGSGVSEASGVPATLDMERNLAWRTPVPFGRSSPVLAGGKVFLTGAEAEQFLTIALDVQTGAELWRRGVDRARRDEIYRANDSSSATPVTDGERLYVFFQELGLLAYDLEGNELWRLPLGPYDNFYGMGSSLVVSGQTLLLQADQASGSFLLAVDTGDGEPRWRVERPLHRESHATPLLLPSGDPDTVVLLGWPRVSAYSIDSGDLLWESDPVGYGPVSSPLLVGDLLVVNTIDQEGAALPSFDQVLADHDGGDGRVERQELPEDNILHEFFGVVDGDHDGFIVREEYESLQANLTNDDWGLTALRLPTAPGQRAETVWTFRQSTPYIPTPIVVGGVLFIVRDGGIVTSLDVATGAAIKRGRYSPSAGTVFASPVSAGGRIYLASVEGEVGVIAAEAQWEVLDVLELPEPVYATPALAPGLLLIRAGEHVYAFRE